MKTLVFVGNQSPQEGAPHQLMPAIWLSRRGFRLLALCSGESQGDSFTTPLGSVAARFIRPARGFLGTLRWQAALFIRLLALRLRLRGRASYYVHGSVSCPAAWMALWGVGRARRLYHSQDFLEPGRHPAWAFFERRVALAASQVVCNEPNRGRFMASHYRLPAVPLTLPTALPRAWPLKRFNAGARLELARRLGLKSGPSLRLVLHQGPYSRLRCSAEVLRALRLLPRGYVLIFTGSQGWPQGALDGLGARVRVLPRLAYAELLELTALCDLGLLLYPNDGVGNFYQSPGRLSECLGSGLPLVASRFPGLELLFMKHSLGELCDPGDPRQIAEAIRRIGSAGKRESLARRRRLRKAFVSELCFDRGARAWEGAVGRLGGA